FVGAVLAILPGGGSDGFGSHVDDFVEVAIYDDVVQVRVGRNSRLSVAVQRGEWQRLVAKAAGLAAVDEDSSGRDAQRRGQVVQQGSPVLLVGVDAFGVHYCADTISRHHAQRFG